MVFTQINFARNIDLGFHKDNMLVVSGSGLLTIAGQEGFIQRLRANPDILDVAMISAPPFDTSHWQTSSAQLAGHPEYVELKQRVIRHQCVPVLGMKLVAGRLLVRQARAGPGRTQCRGASANDGHNILIDEAGAARLGLDAASRHWARP